mgnify:CR=1 FL=1
MDTVSTDWAAASYLAQRLRLLPLAFPVANGFWEGGCLPDGWLTLHPLVIQSCKKQIDTLSLAIFTSKIAMENPNLQWENQRKCGDDHLKMWGWSSIAELKGHLKVYGIQTSSMGWSCARVDDWRVFLVGPGFWGWHLVQGQNMWSVRTVRWSWFSCCLLEKLWTKARLSFHISYMSLINASGFTSLHF